MSNVLFVRVSTPMGTSSITTETLARGMANDPASAGVEQNMLHDLVDAGFIEQELVSDMIKIAATMSKYVRPTARDSVKQYAEVYHGEEPRYAR